MCAARSSAGLARGVGAAVANTADELSAALKSVRAREPQSATSDPTQLIEHLQGLLDEWGAASPRSLADRKIA